MRNKYKFAAALAAILGWATAGDAVACTETFTYSGWSNNSRPEQKTLRCSGKALADIQINTGPGNYRRARINLRKKAHFVQLLGFDVSGNEVSGCDGFDLTDDNVGVEIGTPSSSTRNCRYTNVYRAVVTAERK